MDEKLAPDEQRVYDEAYGEAKSRIDAQWPNRPEALRDDFARNRAQKAVDVQCRGIPR
jgi:hypothetical protein